ncbi:transcriptional coactivator p15/PC4 family protein [Pandoraea pnomenusa]|uniref:transcriptional coactivator p15/PC4 family protein n=1 Tax=Pandoraea pnomenusa TaxID=93220 RepID=UPI003CE8579E
MSQKKSAPQGAEKNLINETNVNTVGGDGVCFFDERKNDSERLRVHLKEYRGKTYVDVRVWFSADGGELRPSSKGIMLRPDLAGPLAAALTDAAMAYDGKGVI